MSSPRDDEVEAAVFVRWVNHCLQDPELSIENLETGFKDGIVLTRLVETLSGLKLGKINANPKLGVQRMDNISKCFEALATKFNIVAPVALSVQDMAHGKPDTALLRDILWDVALRFQIGPALEHAGAAPGPPYKEKAIAWLGPIGKLVKVANLSSGMQDGRALCAMLYQVDSSLLDYDSMKKSDPAQNFQSAFLLLEVEYGMWLPLLPEEGARASERCFCLLLSYCMQQFGDLSNPKPVKVGSAAKPSSILARARTEGKFKGTGTGAKRRQDDGTVKARSTSDRPAAGLGDSSKAPRGRRRRVQASASDPPTKSLSADAIVSTNGRSSGGTERASKARIKRKSSPRASSGEQNSGDPKKGGEALPNGEDGLCKDKSATVVTGDERELLAAKDAKVMPLEGGDEKGSKKEKGQKRGSQKKEEKKEKREEGKGKHDKEQKEEKAGKGEEDSAKEVRHPKEQEPLNSDAQNVDESSSAKDGSRAEEEPTLSGNEQEETLKKEEGTSGSGDSSSPPSVRSEPILRRILSKKDKKQEKKKRKEARRSARLSEAKGFASGGESSEEPGDRLESGDGIAEESATEKGLFGLRKSKKKKRGSEPTVLTAGDSVSPRKTRKAKNKSQGHPEGGDGVRLRGGKKPRIKGTASMMVSPTISKTLDMELAESDDPLARAVAAKEAAEDKLARLNAEVLRSNAQTVSLVSSLMAEIEQLKNNAAKPTKEEKKAAKMDKQRARRSSNVVQVASQFPPLQQPHRSSSPVAEQTVDEKRQKKPGTKQEKAEHLEKSSSESEMKKGRSKKSSLGRAAGRAQKAHSSDQLEAAEVEKPHFGRTTSTYEPLSKDSHSATMKEKGIVRIMLHDGTYRTIPVKKGTTVAETKEVLIQRLAKKSESAKGRAVIEADLRSSYFIVQETLLEASDCLLEIAKKNDNKQTRLVFREPNAQPAVVVEEKVLPAELETVTRGTDTIVSILANRVQTLEQEADGLRAQLERLKVKSKGKRKLAVDTARVDVNERLAEIGGSFARVCGATVDGWGCALKELNLVECEDPQLFEQEIAVLEYLPYHPNIVRYLYHERSDTTLQLFMTRYHGTLGNYLGRRKEQKCGYFTPADIQKYLLDISSGLSFLHNHGIMHRDLKSDNVFVTVNESRGILRLAIGDFDTAKFMKRTGRPKTVIGTPSFIAPEVLTAKQTGGYDYKADVYSLGMVIFEILTLLAPYELEKCTVLEISKNTQDGVRPSLPDDLDEIYKPIIDLHRLCTEPEPMHRPDASKVLDLVKEMPFIANPNAQIFIEYA